MLKAALYTCTLYLQVSTSTFEKKKKKIKKFVGHTVYDSTTVVRIAISPLQVKWCDSTFPMAMISFQVILPTLKSRWKSPDWAKQDEGGKNRSQIFQVKRLATRYTPAYSLKKTCWLTRQKDCVPSVLPVWLGGHESPFTPYITGIWHPMALADWL